MAAAAREFTFDLESKLGDDGAGPAKESCCSRSRRRVSSRSVVSVDHAEAASEDGAVTRTAGNRDLRIRDARIRENRPVEDVDELTPEIKVILLFDPEMASDVRVFSRLARAAEVRVIH